ncbi:MAG TPA: hypothetical protein DCY27_10000, partial [Desulfobacterales bacterium]|nr:hypothetical protein [Desulfobacterales bacterium]
MGRKSWFIGWIGLACLGIFFLLGLGWLKALPVRISPAMPPTAIATAPASPVVQNELPPALPASPALEPNTSSNQSPQPVFSPPDQGPRPPVHIVRSESYQRLEQLINK